MDITQTQEARDLTILNALADELNKEAEDVIEFQITLD
jgi:hypothetical protein